MRQTQCFVCDKPEQDVHTACKACRKQCRAVIAAIETFPEMLKMPCVGHANGKKHIMHDKYYPHTTALRISNWTTGKTEMFNNNCRLCAEEVGKECDLRTRHDKQKVKIKKALNETLKERCARIVAMDPGLLLVATTHDPPIGEDLWHMIHDKIPISMNKEYKEALEESMQNNQSEWMYKTIGTVFSRYVGGTGNKKMRITK